MNEPQPVATTAADHQLRLPNWKSGRESGENGKSGRGGSSVDLVSRTRQWNQTTNANVINYSLWILTANGQKAIVVHLRWGWMVTLASQGCQLHLCICIAAWLNVWPKFRTTQWRARQQVIIVIMLIFTPSNAMQSSPHTIHTQDIPGRVRAPGKWGCVNQETGE